MKFILDNPAILLVLVALAARFLRRRSAASRAESAGAPAPGGREDERTRRVREEVQRRIAERRMEAAPPPVAARAAPVSVPPARPPAPAPVSDIEEVLAEQRKLAEEVQALDRARPVFSRAPVAAAAAVQAREPGLPGLGSPQTARQAIVLREVLGPPRGLTLEGCLWR
jgi:hypothetical protein